MEEEIIAKPKLNFKDILKKNKIKFFSIIVLIIISIIGFIILSEYKTKDNIDISEKYNKAKILIENKRSE